LVYKRNDMLHEYFPWWCYSNFIIIWLRFDQSPEFSASLVSPISFSSELLHIHGSLPISFEEISAQKLLLFWHLILPQKPVYPSHDWTGTSKLRLWKLESRATALKLLLSAKRRKFVPVLVSSGTCIVKTGEAWLKLPYKIGLHTV